MSGLWTMTARGTFALAALLGVGLQPLASGAGYARNFEGVLELKAFRTGPITTNTHRFLPVGKRGETEVRRHDFLLFAFSERVNSKSVNSQTIRVGTLNGGGDFVQAKGAFYQFPESEFDPVTGLYVPVRARRKWWFFDPTARQEFDKNYEGFDPNTTYTVMVPGRDAGPGMTVATLDGRRLERTFQTTFTTTSEPLDYDFPSIVGIEATDIAGVPLDGRTDVDPSAGISIQFSEPMLPASFYTNYRDRYFFSSTVALLRGGKKVRTSVEVSSDLTTYTIRPRRGRLSGAHGLRFRLSYDVADRYGNSLSDPADVFFWTSVSP